IRRWSWLTGAAAAVISGLVLLGWPKTPTASAFASIARATREAVVVKQILESNLSWERHCELWAARGRFSARVVNNGELIEYQDMNAGEKSTYTRTRNAVILSSYDPGDAERAYYGIQSVDDVADWLESFGQDASAWSQRRFERDGRSLVEYFNESNTRSYYRRFVAEARTNRLVEAEGNQGLMRFEYPDVEPRDVFDLGAPTEARVIDGRAPEVLLQLRERVMAQRGTGFGAYRAAVVLGGERAMLYQTLTDGVRFRTRTFVLTEMATAEEVLRAAHDFVSTPPACQPSTVSIFDGTYETSVGFDPDRRPARRSVRGRAIAMYWANSLEGHSRIYTCGFFGNWGDTQVEFLEPDARGWLGFRQRGQGNEASRPYSNEKWYDPAHGHREVLAIHTDFPTANWQLDPEWASRYAESSRSIVEGGADAPAHRNEAEVTQWSELRPGLWYPRLRTSRSLVQRDDGTWALREWPNCEDCRAVTHVAIVAEALDSVDPAEFAIPAAWLEIPVTQ
ncbi:MAG: hypothetical protein IT450_00285, partial [Phycisphaerales bacterium]|nr:hypothetical protein [Phycisphaerales bacterium]